MYIGANILAAGMEFYCIQAIEARMLEEAKLEPFRKSHERWVEDFNAYKNAYIKQMAHMIYDYTVTVVGGEMRHAEDKASMYCADYPSVSSRTVAFDMVHAYEPRQLLKVAIEVFQADNWESGYGGEAWANIAKAGLMYNNIPDVVFIDHCIDLSHNSSVYFDKPDNGILHITDVDDYKKFLDFKYLATPVQILAKLRKSKILKRLLVRAVNVGIISEIIDTDIPKDVDPEDYDPECSGFYGCLTQKTIDNTVLYILAYEEEAIVWGLKKLSPMLCESNRSNNDDDDYDEEDDDYEEEEEEEDQYDDFIFEQYEGIQQDRAV